MTKDERRTAYPRVLIWTFFLCTALSEGCAVVPLSAGSIDSQVVDAETHSPLPGAIVVAYWELSPGSLTGDSMPCGAAHVEETLTDKDGNYHLPGWVALPACNGYMRDGEPMIYVFKPGYFSGRFANGDSDNPLSIRTNDYWQGRQMKLEPVKDMDPSHQGEGSYFRDFNGFEIDLGWVFGDARQCNWKKLPNIVRAVAIQERDMGYNGLIAQIIANDDWYQKVAPDCGSPRKFIEELIDPRVVQDYACMRMLPDSLQSRLDKNYLPGFQMFRAPDTANHEPECTHVVQGDFEGNGATGYAFYLYSFQSVPMMIVATPKGQGWAITNMPAFSLDTRHPGLIPAAPGTYTKSTNPLVDSSNSMRINYRDSNERDAVTAPHVGFIETWGDPIARAHFFIDGKWVFVPVDAPEESIIH